MLRDNRVLFYHASVFSDLSVSLSNFHSSTETFNYVASADYLYIGSDLPFNHRYFDVGTPNDVAATLSVDVWSGSAWIPAVDVIDETRNAAGHPFAQSGIISWQVDWDASSWNFDDTDEMTAPMTSAPKIFGLYWARLSWSANLKNTMTLAYVGHKFSSDEALEAEYPELALSNIKTAFESGKTDWKEQTLVAAEYIIQDLRGKKNLIQSPNQILDWRIFEKASIHKTAEIVYRAFGDDYENDLLKAMRAYKDSMDLKRFHIDQNRDATLTEAEKVDLVTYAKR